MIMARPKKLMTSEQAAEALGLVVDGLTYDEIAVDFKMSRRSLCSWLESLPDNAHARAREASAESWLDRGFRELESCLTAPPEGMSVEDAQVLKMMMSSKVQAARHYEQACARRAALRNRRYAEKTVHEHTGVDGGAMQLVTRIELVDG
jgi:hypothetical protein